MRPTPSAHFHAETKKSLGIQSGHQAATYTTQLIGLKLSVTPNVPAACLLLEPGWQRAK